jgi:hypothetical protein
LKIGRGDHFVGSGTREWVFPILFTPCPVHSNHAVFTLRAKIEGKLIPARTLEETTLSTMENWDLEATEAAPPIESHNMDPIVMELKSKGKTEVGTSLKLRMKEHNKLFNVTGTATTWPIFRIYYSIDIGNQQPIVTSVSKPFIWLTTDCPSLSTRGIDVIIQLISFLPNKQVVSMMIITCRNM